MTLLYTGADAGQASSQRLQEHWLQDKPSRPSASECRPCIQDPDLYYNFKFTECSTRKLRWWTIEGTISFCSQSTLGKAGMLNSQASLFNRRDLQLFPPGELGMDADNSLVIFDNPNTNPDPSPKHASLNSPDCYVYLRHFLDSWILFLSQWNPFLWKSSQVLCKRMYYYAYPQTLPL